MQVAWWRLSPAPTNSTFHACRQVTICCVSSCRVVLSLAGLSSSDRILFLIAVANRVSHLSPFQRGGRKARVCLGGDRLQLCCYLIIPNRSLGRLLYPFSLFKVSLCHISISFGILSTSLSRRSPLRLRQRCGQSARNKYSSGINPNDRFGLKEVVLI